MSDINANLPLLPIEVESPFDPRIDQIFTMMMVDDDFKKKDRILQEIRNLVNNYNNADAYYLLALCYGGSQFIDPNFEFNTNNHANDIVFVCNMLNNALANGSFIAMLGARRFKEYIPLDNVYFHPPYNSDKEVFLKALEYAKKGNMLCKYTVANAIYWGDIFEILSLSNSQRKDMVEYILYEDMAYSFYLELLEKGYPCKKQFFENKDDILRIRDELNAN